MGRALWIAQKLREHGVNVVEVAGWRTRGSDTFNPRGVVCHHTAGGAGEAPSLKICINGRSDLPGPLANIVLGRSGTAYVIASGRANHAGKGGYAGMTGNSSVFGIEAENKGYPTDPWPAVQLDAYYKICKALVDGMDSTVDKVCGHKEWAPGRKPDPHSIDMNDFRRHVAGSNTIPSVPVPNVFKLGSTGQKVRDIQSVCNFWGWNAGAVDGVYGPSTVEAVKRLQSALKIPVDGIWGPGTDKAYLNFAAAMSALNKPNRPTLKLGDSGEWVKTAQKALGFLTVDGNFGAKTQARVIKIQRLKGLRADGIIGEQTWNAIL